ncbi:MAG: type II secretion system F family protein [Blastochloris sp.]|nr:type II secretion system F family protein [Blastochloris sp.]
MMLILIGITISLTLILLAKAFTLSKPKIESLASRVRTAQNNELQGSGVGIRDAEVMDKNIMTRIFLPLSNKLSKNFSALTPATMIAKADMNIAQAGLMGVLTGVQLTTLSWILMSILPVGCFILFLPHLIAGKISLLMLVGGCAIAAFLGYRLPVGIVAGKAKKRQHEILLALPFTFDLISISVQAGMAFDGAMAIVAERTKGALSDEMKRTLREISLGISRYDALVNLAKRTGVDDLRTFVSAVNYITKLGGNLTEVIKIQTESMRVKRRQRAEKAAAQAPVKIMIPLVLFILPCLFIVILGPAALMFLVKKE